MCVCIYIHIYIYIGGRMLMATWTHRDTESLKEKRKSPNVCLYIGGRMLMATWTHRDTEALVCGHESNPGTYFLFKY